MSKKKKVEVLIDSREDDEVIETIVLHEDIKDFRVEELEEGDIIIGDCIFERKTPSDFASSVEDGRLRDQIERMAARKKEGKSPHLLIEGNMGDFDNLTGTNMPPKSLRGMVGAIVERNHIPVTFCSTPYNLADMAVRMARKNIEPATIEAKQTGAVKEATALEQLFMIVDGVGYHTAQDIAKEFNNFEEAVDASEEDFTEVEGVGEKTAKEIVETFHPDKQTEEKEEKEPKTFTI